MKNYCKNCKTLVPEGEVISIGVQLIGGHELPPQIFQHNKCGGVIVHFDCECDEPQCAKCLSINCKDKNCPTHTRESKIAWRKRWEAANNKPFPEPENF